MGEYDDIRKSYSLRQFNGMMLFKKQPTASVLDHLKYNEQNKRGVNSIIMNIASDMRKLHNWQEVYGLNIIETLDLELSTYNLLKDELVAYNKLIAEVEQKHKRQQEQQNPKKKG